jgi:hypothetical protein
MPVKDIPITDLAHEPIERSAAHLDPERVAYYAGNLDIAAPVVVFDVAGQLLLADGYHRVAAPIRLGRSTIRADVRVGHRADALRFAARLAESQRGLSEDQAVAAIMRRAEEPPGSD